MGRFSDKVKLEEVPAVKPFNQMRFAALYEAEYEEREAIKARNRAKLEQAESFDMEYELEMAKLDKLDSIVGLFLKGLDAIVQDATDKLVDSIDKHTEAIKEQATPHMTYDHILLEKEESKSPTMEA